jgi:hypothetical protein
MLKIATASFGLTMRDKITGFTGTATGYVQYITGCNQYLLAPKVGEDGDLKSPQWFDEQRLEVVGETRIELDNGGTPGADRPAPIR